MQKSPQICPQCQASIPDDAPGGLCPACILRGAAQPATGRSDSATAPSLEEVEAAFSDLEMLELLGRGGMGVVFKARQPRLDRLVALKILPPGLARQPGFAERFTREARALARLSHPHIVAVHDFGERAGFYYLLMEFVNGVNLRQAMRAGVTPQQALLLVPRICEALQFAHDHGVLHRDIKPENILLDTAGVPKLADFGVAKLADEAVTATGLTQTGAQLGTAAYMAPEQIEKPATVDHRADIYSLGVVLYEMLTGELPLGRFAAPSDKAQVGEKVDDVVLRALEKERERRQQSAAEMKTQVEDARAGERLPPALAAGETPSEDLWPRVFFALSALSGAGIVVAGMLRWTAPSPVHMLALAVVFGTLYWVAKSFTPRTSRPAAPRPPWEKDTGMAYLLWFLFGLVGGHRFYLGQVGWGLLYLVTGGLFFVGWFIDLFTLPSQVRRFNEDLRRRQPAGALPLGPAGPSSPWPARAALIVLILIAGLIVAWTSNRGKWIYPAKDGSWTYQLGGEKWNMGGQLNYHGGSFEVGMAPNTPAPATPAAEPASSNAPPDPAHARPTPTPKPE